MKDNVGSSEEGPKRPQPKDDHWFESGFWFALGTVVLSMAAAIGLALWIVHLCK